MLERRLLRQVGRASHEHRLLEPNDRVMVALSGGKDSHVLLHLLSLVQKKAPFQFSLLVVNVDQRQPGFPEEVLPRYLAERGFDFEIVREDTWSLVREKLKPGQSYCSLCSRLRRGILYTTARRLGATKIALGHHRDDCIETLLLNAFFAGRLSAMPPRLRADDGLNVVIRPLITCAEAEIAEYAGEMGFPLVPCACDAQPQLERLHMKQLLDQLEKSAPHVRSSLFSALGRVRPTHLLDRMLTERLGESEAHEGDDDEPDLVTLVPR